MIRTALMPLARLVMICAFCVAAWPVPPFAQESASALGTLSAVPGAPSIPGWAGNGYAYDEPQRVPGPMLTHLIASSYAYDGGVNVPSGWHGTGAALAAEEAQANLAFGRTPSGYFEVPESRLPGLSQPSVVRPNGGQLGGGLECWVTCEVNAQGLKWNPLS